MRLDIFLPNRNTSLDVFAYVSESSFTLFVRAVIKKKKNQNRTKIFGNSDFVN